MWWLWNILNREQFPKHRPSLSNYLRKLFSVMTSWSNAQWLEPESVLVYCSTNYKNSSILFLSASSVLETTFLFEHLWKVCFALLGQACKRLCKFNCFTWNIAFLALYQQYFKALSCIRFRHISTFYFKCLCSMLFQVHCIYFEVWSRLCNFNILQH